MTDIEQWEPDSEDTALAGIEQARLLLAEANRVEDVADMRDQAEMVRIWAARRDRSHAIELEAQDFIRRAERKMAELIIELREAGLVRKAGRPRKPVQDGQNPGGPVQDGPISPRALFGSGDIHRDANLFASVDEDTFNEAMGAARANDDLSRKAIARALKGTSPRGATETNGDPDFTPIARVMAAVLRNLGAVVERLKEFDPATIDHKNRKEWNNAIREQVNEIEAWRKALPR